jgi:hypothetical protein
MTNKEHCKATEVMLGLKSHMEMHQFMDGFYKSMGWGHRAKRHDYKIIGFMADLYGEQGGLEAAFHIMCDLRLVTTDDLKVWRGITFGEKRLRGRTTVEVRGTKFKLRV